MFNGYLRIYLKPQQLKYINVTMLRNSIDEE